MQDPLQKRTGQPILLLVKVTRKKATDHSVGIGESKNGCMATEFSQGFGRRRDFILCGAKRLLSMLTLGWRFLLIAFFAVGISVRSNEVIDYRDFAIDTYYPKPNEIRLAEERARKFWAKNAGRYGSNPVYLAVETSKLFESEIVQDLWPKLINSKTLLAFSQGRQGIAATKSILKAL